jgi:hypothetical protein
MKLNRKPKRGEIYAVHSGVYAGEMLIFIKCLLSSFHFLSIPTMQNRIIPLKSFDFARNNDIIEYVEQLPADIVAISIKQYTENEKLNNRLNPIKSF